MPSFEDQFIESGGKPIDYNGNKLTLLDRFPAPKDGELKLTFEEFGSPWKQGVVLRTDGEFVVGSQAIKKAIVLWQGSAPREVLLRVRCKDGIVEVNNVWDTGNGSIESWHNGAAMIVEELSIGRRYRCNDGHPDDDFDDVVFRLERL